MKFFQEKTDLPGEIDELIVSNIDDFPTLIKLIQVNSKLRILKLEDGSIRPEQAFQILQALAQSEHRDIRHIQFSVDGVLDSDTLQLIPDIIASNKYLSEFRINTAGISFSQGGLIPMGSQPTLEQRCRLHDAFLTHFYPLTLEIPQITGNFGPIQEEISAKFIANPNMNVIHELGQLLDSLLEKHGGLEKYLNDYPNEFDIYRRAFDFWPDDKAKNLRLSWVPFQESCVRYTTENPEGNVEDFLRKTKAPFGTSPCMLFTQHLRQKGRSTPVPSLKTICTSIIDQAGSVFEYEKPEISTKSNHIT